MSSGYNTLNIVAEGVDFVGRNPTNVPVELFNEYISNGKVLLLNLVMRLPENTFHLTTIMSCERIYGVVDAYATLVALGTELYNISLYIYNNEVVIGTSRIS